MITFTTLYTELLPLLNAASAADLVWWTADELYRFMDEASRRLGESGVFSENNTEITTATGGSSYVLPDDTLAIAAAFLDGAALRAVNVREMESLSLTWDSDTGTPVKFATDVSGLRTIMLYPQPTADGTLALILHTWPEVGSGGSVRQPAVLGLHLKYSALAAARAKDSDGAAPDIAQSARQRADLIQQAASALWGGVR